MSHSNLPPGDPASSPILAVSFEGGAGERSGSDPLRAIVAGEIDVATAGTMQSQIADARKRVGSSNVVLDLEGVQFMDSSGLRVLVQLEQELASEEGGLVLLSPMREVEKVLVLTGLDRHLRIAQSIEQARSLLAAAKADSDNTDPGNGAAA